MPRNATLRLERSPRIHPGEENRRLWEGLLRTNQRRTIATQDMRTIHFRPGEGVVLWQLISVPDVRFGPDHIVNIVDVEWRAIWSKRFERETWFHKNFHIERNDLDDLIIVGHGARTATPEDPTISQIAYSFEETAVVSRTMNEASALCKELLKFLETELEARVPMRLRFALLDADELAFPLLNDGRIEKADAIVDDSLTTSNGIERFLYAFGSGLGVPIGPVPSWWPKGRAIGTAAMERAAATVVAPINDAFFIPFDAGVTRAIAWLKERIENTPPDIGTPPPSRVPWSST